MTLSTSTEHQAARHLRDAAADVGPVAELIVDRDGTVVHVNQHLRSLFGLSQRDVGRPLQDFELSYRPFDLRSAIDRAYVERRPSIPVEAPWSAFSGLQVFLELTVVPVFQQDGGPAGASCFFTDVTRHHRLQEEVQRSAQALETALEELQSTNEVLETTNEELQSTVEALETTNQELQSTNEELETINEELESTNEALQTINGELHDRGDELPGAGSARTPPMRLR